MTQFRFKEIIEGVSVAEWSIALSKLKLVNLQVPGSIPSVGENSLVDCSLPGPPSKSCIVVIENTKYLQNRPKR